MSKYKVVLDPGHGQYGNPYPAASGYYEGTQMFKLASMIKAKLVASGIDVIVTRTKISDDPSLAVRGSTAGNNKADMFISLHSDAIGNAVSTTARGVSVFYSIQDAVNNKKFASNLAAAVSSLMETNNRGAQTRIGSNNLDYYGVIRNSASSGCKTAFLIEHGFHTNPTDVKWLINDSKLAQVAETDAKIICDWFSVTYAGTTIGNNVTVVPTTSITSSEKYALYTEVPKYLTATNALNGDTSLSAGKLAVGEYYIYKTYNGAYNLTKTAGVAGSWINPKDNVKAEAPSSADHVNTVEKYSVFRTVNKYSAAADASALLNNQGTAEPGVYFVYKESAGMYNLTTKEGTAGFWMNPIQNIYTAFCTIDADGADTKIAFGDTVMFRTGFTPVYGGGGTNIPVSVIISVCSAHKTKVTNLRLYAGTEYEVFLDTIEAWVPIKYLYVYAKAESTISSDATETPTTTTGDASTVTTEEEPTTDAKEDTINIDDFAFLKDEKYAGIVSAIKSGAMVDFLNKVIEELYEDDTVEDGTLAYELILGNSVATKQQMVDFVSKNNAGFNPAIADAFLTISKDYGIRGDVAFCQSIIETGWFKFADGTAVTPEQHNYCGLGVTSLGSIGNVFSTIENGVEAQIQHLYAYGSTSALPAGKTLYDPRFSYVIRGSAPRWIDLDGKWCAGSGYGEKALSLWSQILLG